MLGWGCGDITRQVVGVRHGALRNMTWKALQSHNQTDGDNRAMTRRISHPEGQRKFRGRGRSKGKPKAKQRQSEGKAEAKQRQSKGKAKAKQRHSKGKAKAKRG